MHIASCRIIITWFLETPEPNLVPDMAWLPQILAARLKLGVRTIESLQKRLRENGSHFPVSGARKSCSSIE